MPFTPLDPSIAQIAPVTSAGEPVIGVGTNLAEFHDGLIEDLQGRGDISSRIDRWINFAYQNLASMLEINELNASMLFPLVADQPFYLLPEVVSWIQWIGVEDSTNYLDGGRGFEMTTRETYRTLPDSTSSITSGILPYKYFRIGRMLVIWPTPAEAFDATMDFRVRPLPMTAVDHCPILPPEFHSVIYDMAQARALRKLGFRSEGDRVYNDAISTLRPMINSDANERDNLNMVLVPVRSRAQLYRSR